MDVEEERGPVQFKKSNRSRPGRRKREHPPTDEEDSDDEESAVVRNEERRGRDRRVFQRTNTKAMSKPQGVAGDSDEEEEAGKESRITMSYKSTEKKERAGPQDMGATSIVQIDTEVKGKKESNKKKGPLQAPQFLRSTVRWDYQPDICKDYKETGYCGFGDSCKFLHDRTDYKSGWQLDREFEENQGRGEDMEQYEISSSDEELPFACYICRETFRTPIITKCKHYFCESCALAHYRKSKRCALCGEPTAGVFNPAKELIQKLKKQQKLREDDEEEEKEEEGDSDRVMDGSTSWRQSSQGHLDSQQYT